MNNTLTCLKGVKVGHSKHPDKLTGCTVVLFDKYHPVAYVSHGGAPGTFSTENLKPGKSFSNRIALFIAGGSLTGLASATTITDWLIKKKIGGKDGAIYNPAISGAIVWDLGVYVDQYNPEYGREAIENVTEEPVKGGNVGAGTGTTVGSFSYTKDFLKLDMKSGVGSARMDLGNGVIVCALSVVNALGNIVKPDGTILAGNRNDNSTPKFRNFENSSKFMTGATNTTISIVGMNVAMKSHIDYERIAHIASHGQIRAIHPSQASVDGDTVFVFSTEEIEDYLSPLGKSIQDDVWPELNVDVIAQTAAKVVQESIYDACNQAETIQFKGAYKGVIPSAKDY